ncbi:DUF6313 family protein [Streptomyces sp. NEAU-174]|uniref:DUF6313 family protein n=1 Tax=Streptomyces sp. NEAU-174 TaxID=3458254 RepID=UPI00404404F2
MVLTVCAATFIVNGVLTGWASAYEILIGIKSPAEVDPQWATWPLSVIGWAAVPAFVGGAAGYLITSQIQSHQSRDFDAVIAELRALIEAPTNPGGGA